MIDKAISGFILVVATFVFAMAIQMSYWYLPARMASTIGLTCLALNVLFVLISWRHYFAIVGTKDALKEEFSSIGAFFVCLSFIAFGAAVFFFSCLSYFNPALGVSLALRSLFAGLSLHLSSIFWIVFSFLIQDIKEYKNKRQELPMSLSAMTILACSTFCTSVMFMLGLVFKYEASLVSFMLG